VTITTLPVVTHLFFLANVPTWALVWHKHTSEHCPPLGLLALRKMSHCKRVKARAKWQVDTAGPSAQHSLHKHTEGLDGLTLPRAEWPLLSHCQGNTELTVQGTQDHSHEPASLAPHCDLSGLHVWAAVGSRAWCLSPAHFWAQAVCTSWPCWQLGPDQLPPRIQQLLGSTPEPCKDQFSVDQHSWIS
jgi:hypothetical protein